MKYLPYAFTEHGAIMAANVINSARAVQMSVFVVRGLCETASDGCHPQKRVSSQISRAGADGCRSRWTYQGFVPSSPAVDDSARTQEAKDRISGEGARSAVRKKLEPSLPRFRNSENVTF